MLDDDIAMQVKNEALRSLKERLLTRADIIQRRLDEEQKRLEAAYVSSTIDFWFGFSAKLELKFEFEYPVTAVILYFSVCSKNLRERVTLWLQLTKSSTRRKSPRPTSEWTS